MIRIARTMMFAALLATNAALAEPTRLSVGYTSGGDVSAAFVAREMGIFARHGLDVSLTATAFGANFPAALVSGSFDIATPTGPVLLLAAAGGIEEVVVSGGSVAYQRSHNHAVVARPNSPLATPADFVGRKVAMAGFGGFLDLLFEEWIKRAGIDPKRVVLVEMGQPQMADALKGGTVDAVVAAEPNVSRMLGSGVGHAVIFIDSQFPDELPVILYAGARDWVAKHPAVARAFADSIAEASTYALAHPDELRRTIAGYTKLPPEIVDAAGLPDLHPAVTAAQLGLWNPILRSQGALSADVDTARLLDW